MLQVLYANCKKSLIGQQTEVRSIHVSDDRQGEISHHLTSLGMYNFIVGIAQGGHETQISQLGQFWKFHLMPILGHAHIWPTRGLPPIYQKSKFIKYGHIIHQSKANSMLINNSNRTQGEKSTRFEFWPYMGMPIYGHAPNIPKIDAYQIWSYHISIESKFIADQ